MNALEQQTELVSVDFNPFENSPVIDKIISINKAQQEIFLSCVMGGESANLAYNESVSIVLEGELEVNLLEKAFRQIVTRHEALRSVISGNGEKVIIYQYLDFDVIKENLSDLDPGLRQKKLTDFAYTQMATPFDLHSGPLFRLALHQIQKERFQITLIIHHIICDGWSLGIILEELSKLYTSFSRGVFSLLPNAFQISEFALTQDKYLSSRAFQETERFWLEEYANQLPQINIPTDYPRGTQRSYHSQRIDQMLAKDIVDDLRKAGAKIGCSLVTTMLSLFEILLYKITKQQELIVGLPSAAQAASGFYSLVGHCVNILPIKTFIDPEVILDDYLKAKRTHLLDVYEHQQYSFSQLIEKLNFKRDAARIPLVPIVFNIDMGMDSEVNFNGLKHQIISNVRQSETFELFVNATDTSEGLTLEWNYNAQLFARERIEKMIAEYKRLIDCYINRPQSRIAEAVSFGEKKVCDQWCSDSGIKNIP